jgi:predicted ATPase with chaperone activity
MKAVASNSNYFCFQDNYGRRRVYQKRKSQYIFCLCHYDFFHKNNIGPCSSYLDHLKKCPIRHSCSSRFKKELSNPSQELLNSLALLEL